MNWLEDFFQTVPPLYGYTAIFLFLVVGVFALPLPDEVIMLTIGYWTATGSADLTPAFISAAAGSMCGVSMSYLLGRRFGYPLLTRFGPKIAITPRRLHIARTRFRKHGDWLLFIGFFIPGVRHLTAYLSGISGTKYTRFASFAYPGAALWCGFFVGLGRVVGHSLEMIEKTVRKYGFLALIAAVIISSIWCLWQWFLMPRLRRRRLSTKE